MKPLFQVGQKVTIKNRGKDFPRDYPYSFTDSMIEYSGLQMTIERVVFNGASTDRKYAYYHDGYQYSLLEDGGRWMWSSSMFKETYEL